MICVGIDVAKDKHHFLLDGRVSEIQRGSIDNAHAALIRGG